MNMKRNLLVITLVLSMVLDVVPAFSATVINKEDAALFSKKSIYSDIIEETKAGDQNSHDSGMRLNDESLNRFQVATATKEGNTYTNIWSNYKLTIEDQYANANDVYDFYADGMKFDFGLYFYDYSRIAVYYTRLSRDLNVVAANFAPGAPVTDVTIAGEVYKHVSHEVPYPYGVEKYDYYLRNIDGKLMVIELYWEDGRDICKDYIDKFTRAKD